MKKALAKHIKTHQLLEILKNFKEDEHIDIEVFEFSDGSPDKIIIRTSDSNGNTKTPQKEEDKDPVENPKLSDNIPYKDLLDNLN